MAKVKANIPEQPVDAEMDSDSRARIEEVDDTAETAVALRYGGTIGALTGDISQSDIPMPPLNVVYGVGDLAAKFSPGDLVLDREHLLVQKTQPLNVIIVSGQIYWKEYLDQAAYASGLIPRIFRDEDEVLAAGGTTAYGPNDEKPTFKRAATLKLLIEKPEKVECYLFTIDLLGKKYAPAKWFVDKTAYARARGRGVGLELMKQASFALKQRGLLAGKWQVTTGFEDIGQNKVVAPNIRLVGQFTDDEIAQIKTAIGA